ncbi:MAG: hypothetical protein KF691_00670 [Phycisphaeraceae bacterium]|nr:hypothetical protein [Phycisphaeraceae bacterium]
MLLKETLIASGVFEPCGHIETGGDSGLRILLGYSCWVRYNEGAARRAGLRLRVGGRGLEMRRDIIMATWMRLIAAAVAVLLCVSFAEAGAARKPKVLFVHSTVEAGGAADVVSKLAGSGVFAQVDAFDAGLGTPTLAQLKAYDAVLCSNQGSWADRTALGNVMSQYVDAGYGVVQAIFTTGGIANSNLGGTWTASYNCITFGSSTSGAATLGTIAVPNHATMIGVQTFDGGSSSYRPSGTALTAGATLIASWSDGKPLVVVGPKINRADLGFWPLSSAVRSDLWNASTDGVKLMVNALLYTIRPKVLVVHSFGGASETNDVIAKLAGTGTLGGVDAFDAEASTPTLAQLQNYDAILVANNFAWSNRVALGNVVADYVDWGGGVVLSMFTVSGIANSDLGGRFTGDYRIINFSSTTSGNATLGAVAYASHPIMAGVGGFDGGNSSYRPTLTTLAPGGLRVAQWSDGKTLVAVSTRRANRADLGFYPPSSTLGASYWSGDGAKLMANALLYVSKPYIGVTASDTTTDTIAKLIASRRFSGVTNSQDLEVGTPGLSALSPFNALLCWSNFNFLNADAVGNVFADYVDAGGSVVEGVFAVTGNAAFANSRPRGRWISQGYDITPEGSTGASISTPATLGAFVLPNNPIATFVRKFDGGTFAYRQGNNPLLRGQRIMNWSDGKMLTSMHNFRKRVDLGFYPPSSDAAGNWNPRTDGTWIMANALDYAVRHAPCPGDLNGDGFVDDADFVLFAGYYDNLIDPRGDLNGDGLTEDSDFVIFAGSYDALLCP